MIALDTLMGTDECIGFEDFLNGVFIDVYYCSTCCFLCRSSTQNSDVDNLSFRAYYYLWFSTIMKFDFLNAGARMLSPSNGIDTFI